MISEANEFTWPGPDLRPVPSGDGSVVYGVLPPRYFAVVKKRLLQRAAKRVPRTE